MLGISSARLAGLALALTLPMSMAAAGEQYVDRTGYAVSGYDVVAYHSLEQSPVGQAKARAVPGNASIVAEWNGAKWAFSTEQNKQTFLANPEAYAPQYDGHCAYGVAEGAKVAGNPHLWRIVDGKLFLNITKKIDDRWERDIAGYIETADSKWNRLERKGASSMARVPELDSSAAPLR